MNTQLRMRAAVAIEARDMLGEAPTWDSSAGRLLWSDNVAGIVHESRPTESGAWRESRRWRLARRIGAAIPRASGGLLVVAGTEVLTVDDAGAIAPFVRLDADAELVRLNDAKCDPRGRLWVGTLASDLVTCGRGALYRIDPDGTVTQVLDNVTLSNGLAWSPNGAIFYYIDSHARAVDAFDFDVTRGEISNRRTLVTFEWGDGLPDGMTVDREGCLWVAVNGTGEVRRYGPDGALLACVETSAPCVTSCAFGGHDGGTLFITSVGMRLPEVVLAHGFSRTVIETSATAPGAGAVFVCRPGTTGPPATPFAG